MATRSAPLVALLGFLGVGVHALLVLMVADAAVLAADDDATHAGLVYLVTLPSLSALALTAVLLGVTCSPWRHRLPAATASLLVGCVTAAWGAFVAYLVITGGFWTDGRQGLSTGIANAAAITATVVPLLPWAARLLLSRAADDEPELSGARS